MPTRTRSPELRETIKRQVLNSAKKSAKKKPDVPIKELEKEALEQLRPSHVYDTRYRNWFQRAKFLSSPPPSGDADEGIESSSDFSGITRTLQFDDVEDADFRSEFDFFKRSWDSPLKSHKVSRKMLLGFVMLIVAVLAIAYARFSLPVTTANFQINEGTVPTGGVSTGKSRNFHSGGQQTERGSAADRMVSEKETAQAKAAAAAKAAAEAAAASAVAAAQAKAAAEAADFSLDCSSLDLCTRSSPLISGKELKLGDGSAVQEVCFAHVSWFNVLLRHNCVPRS
jgi:hypothetical protein